MMRKKWHRHSMVPVDFQLMTSRMPWTKGAGSDVTVITYKCTREGCIKITQEELDGHIDPTALGYEIHGTVGGQWLR